MSRQTLCVVVVLLATWACVQHAYIARWLKAQKDAGGISNLSLSSTWLKGSTRKTEATSEARQDKPREEGTPALTALNNGTKLLAIYRQLLEWNVTSAGRVKTNLSADRRDALAKLYAPLVEGEPPAPLTRQRPGGKLSSANVNCKLDALLRSNLLTGAKRKKGPRVLVDLITGMGGGPELELLELRLHELDGVADVYVVTESEYGNRCDRKEMHYNRTKTQPRFAEFASRIVHVMTSRCPKYITKAEECHQLPPMARPRSIWFQETAQRACAYRALRDERPDLPDDALIVVTDLDEIPDGKTLQALKHCELSSRAVFPLTLQLNVVPFSLRSKCPKTRQKLLHGGVALWKDVKKLKGDFLFPKLGATHVYSAGVHMSAYGSRAQLDYRYMHHGESGMILQMIDKGGKKRNLTEVTTIDHLNSLQEQLNQCPISVVRAWTQPDPNKTKAPALADELQDCRLPWPLLANPERYPFLWGIGSWSV